MGELLVSGLLLVAVYAVTGKKVQEIAKYIKDYDRSTGHVRAHIRGIGKPSLVFRTAILALLGAAVVVRAAMSTWGM